MSQRPDVPDDAGPSALGRLMAIEHLLVVLWSGQIALEARQRGVSQADYARRFAGQIAGPILDSDLPAGLRDAMLANVHRLMDDIVRNAETRDALGI